MYTFKNHFLDSNVVLGLIFQGEKSKYGNYFSLPFRKYVSENVYDECKNVLNYNKDWVLKFINIIKKEFIGKSIDDYKKDLPSIINRIASPYKDHSARMGKKVLDVLSNFSEKYLEELELIITGLNDFKEFRKMVTETFKISQNKLKCILDKLVLMKKSHPAPMGDFFHQYQKLKGMGMHSSDFKLIVDTYFISHHIKKELAFITFDGHIILLKDDIEDEFYIKVFKPT
jgi:hypothetical protein